MKEVPSAVFKAALTIAVIAASPFAKKCGEGLAEKENWQWWNKKKKDEITP